jgi:hypothetical protein
MIYFEDLSIYLGLGLSLGLDLWGFLVLGGVGTDPLKNEY